MRIDFSEGALKRPQQTIQATNVLKEKAGEIARLCAGAEEREIVVAVVNPDIVFGGAWTIPVEHLHERVSLLPAGGWSLTFAPQTSIEQIQARCASISELARKRLNILESRKV
ncbi:MAG TPA: hypothetical protein VFA07_02810 [Chthonomonadaceae bacterium]|nr:hypothetical protein [Chthonomonadaceae bacterium]